uniref:Uncharacterized protein n=1 Tax=Podoviridae sp. ctdKF3 TaxID=2825261 RepID=A0A8S5PQZ8_9CAUD|nr:MAG TPA: hypothetical protein [Podoviridae sp. ctdKF3]
MGVSAVKRTYEVLGLIACQYSVCDFYNLKGGHDWTLTSVFH